MLVSISADSDKYMFKGVDSDVDGGSPIISSHDPLPSVPDALSKKQQHAGYNINKKKAQDPKLQENRH